MSKTIIHLYVDGELVREADIEELQKEAPEWTGEVSLGILWKLMVKRKE